MRPTIVILFAAACVIAAVPVLADPLCDLPVVAYLTSEAGEPLTGTSDLEVRVYVDDAAEALPVECRTLSAVRINRGWARFTLDACAEPPIDDCGTGPLTDVVGTAGDGLWVALVVGAEGSELEPRIAVGAVPYAMRSADAARLGGLGPEAFEPAGALATHAGDPDAHHPADSAGIDIRPASVDLGPDVDDELTAEIVTTLTGGGDADALHVHASSGHASGGLCYTAWGESSCAEEFTLIYAGLAAQHTLVDRGRSLGATGAPICVSMAAVDSTSRLNDWDFAELSILGQSASAINVPGDGFLGCALCCR